LLPKTPKPHVIIQFNARLIQNNALIESLPPTSLTYYEPLSKFTFLYACYCGVIICGKFS